MTRVQFLAALKAAERIGNHELLAAMVRVGERLQTAIGAARATAINPDADLLKAFDAAEAKANKLRQL